MKSTKLFLAIVAFLFGIMLYSQNPVLPEVDIYTLDGIRFKTSDISNNGKPMVMVFWKTYERESCSQLMMLNEVYEKCLKEKEIKVVGICVDCTGRMDHVKPFVFGYDLGIEVYVDKNGDFKRAMHVPDTPFTLLFDQEMKVYCQYIGYCPGFEESVLNKIENHLAKIDK